VTGLSKTYGTIRVLTNLSLTVNSREVHAVVGGNGSGKSTSVKLLAGVIPPDPGLQLEVHGVPVPVGDWSPDAARRAHLRFVHQDLGLFAELSIADNLFIGSGYDAALVGRVRRRDVIEAARIQLRRIGVEHDPRRRLSTLTLAEQSLVAIARALRGVDDDATACVLLDEPTAALPAHDRQNLLDTLRRLADSGHGVLLVTHHIDELLAIADRVTVLRDGHLIHTGPVSELNRSQLIELITGSTANADHARPTVVTERRVRLRLDHFSSGASRSVSLEAKQGEILGLAGLPGSGCDDIAPALFGLESIAAGTVWIDDDVFVPRHPARAMQTGIAFLPADRQRDGVFAGLSVLKNLTAASTRLAGRWRLHHRRERRRGQVLTDQYRVRPADVTRPIGTLSGGNQQKVLLGRWGCRHPRLLLLEDPTRGVDVGARQDIWRLLTDEARSSGLTIIVTSSDAEELATFCDRIIVFRSGHSATELRAGEVTTSAITTAMYESDASEAAA
jgi:ribose transport system ATP-binding protein